MIAGGRGYEEARRVYNAMIDERPARRASARANAGDVIAAVDFARENGLDLAVRGGGHSVPGFGTCDDGVVIDLSACAASGSIRRTETARAEGGATWGDFNAATHAFGLATTGGIISTTGVGRAHAGRRHRLPRPAASGSPATTWFRADVVTADGPFLVASETRERGPVLGPAGRRRQLRRRRPRFEFRLHPVKDIYGGPMFFELDDAG